LHGENKAKSSWPVIEIEMYMVWRVSDCCRMPNQQFLQLYHGKNKLHFWWNGDDDVRFVLDQHPELDF